MYEEVISGGVEKKEVELTEADDVPMTGDVNVSVEIHEDVHMGGEVHDNISVGGEVHDDVKVLMTMNMKA